MRRISLALFVAGVALLLSSMLNVGAASATEQLPGCSNGTASLCSYGQYCSTGFKEDGSCDTFVFVIRKYYQAQ